MILDYKNEREFALANGVRLYSTANYEIIYFCGKSESENETFAERFDAYNSHKNFKNITFRNFPNLELNNSTLENCTFENCADILTDGCAIINSQFTDCCIISSSYTDFYGCTFKDAKPAEALLFLESNCKVDSCTFENIHAIGDEGQICKMLADKEKDVRELTNCKFINCSLENKYNFFSSCQYNS